MIEEVIAKKIIEIHNVKRPVIIAFCGAADLGKSFLAGKVVEMLNDNDIESTHLTLDSFLMDRVERQRKGISGYEIKAHNIKSILFTLKEWKAGHTIAFHPYNHQSGTKSKKALKIKPSEVLLIEGLFSISQQLLPFVDLSFFFCTSDKKLKEIKLEADLIKRNYSEEYSNKIYQEEFELYKKNIEPLGKIADFKLFLHYKWHYSMKPI